MATNTFDPNTLAQLHAGYLATQKQPTTSTTKKGNLLTNLLPAIGGGVGAVAGIPLDIFGGAGSIAGGAAGASLGEALKEKLLGQNLSAKQIGIQGLEGGATAAFQPLKAIKGASTVAKGIVDGGAQAAKTSDTAVMQGVDSGANKLANDLVTQGESAQGRVAGISPGTKIGSTELTPQDQARMLTTLKTQGINTSNANLGLRDVQNKLDTYGKQISDHFTANNTPLNPTDTKTLAASYLTSLKTTDPGVLKQASVLANDLEKNVSDTKSLWEFRKTLDDKIPDSKQGNTLAVSNKIEAVKGLRQYIAAQLGNIPGASQYHDLSELKPFISAEAKRLNNPGGGIIGRLLSSGPVQATESTVGKGLEAVGNKLGATAPTTASDALPQATEQAASSIPQTGTGIGSVLQAQAPNDLTTALQGASDAAGQIGNEATQSLPTTSRAAQALTAIKGTATLPARAVAAPLAYPGKSAVAVGKQVLARAPGEISSALQTPQGNQSEDLTGALMQAGNSQDSTSTTATNQSPYSIDDLQYDMQRDPANATKYIDYYNSLAKIYAPATSTLSGTQAQNAANANSALQSLQTIAQTLQTDPNATKLANLPGGSLISNATGTGQYKAAIANAVDVISRLRSGAAISAQEEKTYKSMLPAAFDSPATIQYKLQTLGSLFQQFANPNGTATTPTNLTDAIVGAQ